MSDVEGTQRPTRYADLPFVVIAAICGVVLLYLGRSLTFWEDEWRSIVFKGGLVDYLRPVNQHWSTFPLLLFRGTFRVVGLRTYLPYLAEVVVLHLAAVTGAYAVMRRRIGPLVSTLAAVPLLFLGSGAENLFWGFQTGFVGSVMFGVWALFFIERSTRRSAVIASLLLVGSLASSGMGLFFLVVAAGRTILDPSLRPRALAVVPPLGVYVLWFGLVGRDPLGDGRVFVEPSIARFAVRGIVYSTERISGLDHLPNGPLWGSALFLGLTLLTGLRIARGHRHGLAAGCLLGVATMYTVIAFVRVRADPGYDHATSSRFVYVAAFLLVLAVVDLLSALSPSSLRDRRLGAVVPVALVLVLACATAANVDALLEKRSEFQRAADVTRAFVALALTRGHEPWVDRDAPRGWMPPVSELVRTIEVHGSPLHDELFPRTIESPGPEAEELALLEMIGDGFRVEEPRGSRELARLDVGGGVSQLGRCARARVVPDAAVWILGLPAGARVRVESSSPLTARVFLAHEGSPGRKLDVGLVPRVRRDVVIPDVGDGRSWNLVLDSPARSGAITLCVVPADDAPRREPRVELGRWE